MSIFTQKNPADWNAFSHLYEQKNNVIYNKEG
jgi:hypothetical protein